MAGDTILVFTSDHGEMNGSQGHDRKIRPWDESILVPFLLHLPDGTGRQIEAPFGLPDIMPTLLDLVGVPVPDGVEGMSFANHMLGQAEASFEASLFGCYVPFANYADEHGGGNIGPSN
jgi:arylsulfatase A-like enzyme